MTDIEAPLSIAEALTEAARQLSGQDRALARRESRLLLAEALNCGAEVLTGYPERLVDPEAQKQFQSYIARRRAGEPISRILGRREFWSLSFNLGPTTLDPRPESECLVKAVLAHWQGPTSPARILDLGVGSGCLLLALLSEWPGAWGLGLDLDEAALSVARGNAKSLGLDTRTAFCRGDWTAALIGPWQVIVSNPPYIKEDEIPGLDRDVRDFDPRLALDGGSDGLEAYRRLAPVVPRLLSKGGIAAFEIGFDQSAAVQAIFQDAGLVIVAVVPDLAGHNRVVLLQAPDRDQG